MEGELKALEAQPGARGDVPTLLWSLDDALRYLPLAALYEVTGTCSSGSETCFSLRELWPHDRLGRSEGKRAQRAGHGIVKELWRLAAAARRSAELDSVCSRSAVPESHGPMGRQAAAPTIGSR